MSLTVSDEYKYASKSTAIKEEWYAKLYYGTGSDFIGIASNDMNIGGVQYYGIVLEWGELTHSIDITKSTATVADITITCVNRFKNGLLSTELFGGTNKYINHKLELFSYINSNSVQLYTGRLVNLNPNQETVVLQIEGYTPWYNITIPQDKSDSRGVYAPVAYGDYSDQSGFCLGIYVYPCPTHGVSGSDIYALIA